MWVVGRIMLIILMVTGVLLIAAGIASLIGADSWADQVEDINIDSGVFIGGGAGGVALGVMLLAISSILLFRRHRPKINTQEKIMPEE